MAAKLGLPSRVCDWREFESNARAVSNTAKGTTLGTIQRLQPNGLVARRFSFPKLFYGRMFGQLRHRIVSIQDSRCVYN